MPATTSDKYFRQPEDQNLKLWRYMDFTKFVAMLDSKSLYFCRSDKFVDPFEGSTTKTNIEMRLYMMNRNSNSINSRDKVSLDDLKSVAHIFRNSVYINCWHANQYESAAMWDLYGKTNEAVAIETEYNILSNALPAKVHLGLINYIDYEKDVIPEGNILHPFAYKRKSFEHEKEARAVLTDFFISEDQIKPNELPGININVDFNNIIKKVYVSPTAPSWFKELVSNIAQKYELSAPVTQSKLYSNPPY